MTFTTTTIDGWRPCANCGYSRPVEEFNVRDYKGVAGSARLKSYCKLCSQAQWRYNTYGLSASDFESMYQFQAGRCAACFCSLDDSDRRRGLHVDHCHESGRVRALLCARCNKTLGMVEDRLWVLNALSSYLRLHGATE